MKTITLSNIEIKEIILTENKGEYTLSVAYSMLDEANEKIATKRIVISAFTDLQKGRLGDILNFIETKVKKMEGI